MRKRSASPTTKGGGADPGRPRAAAALAGAALLLSALPGLLLPRLSAVAEDRSTDLLFKARYAILGRAPVSPYVVHVDFDDASLAALPASDRGAAGVARVLRALARCGVRAVAVDMIFPLEEGSSAERGLEEALRGSGAAYVARATPLLAGRPAFGSGRAVEAAAAGLGSITTPPDADGVYRRAPLFAGGEKEAGGAMPSLALAAAAGYLRVDPAGIVPRGRRVVLRGAAYPDGRIKDIAIPVDGRGRVLVNYPGPWDDAFPHYAAYEIWKAAEDPGLLEALREEMRDDFVVLDDVSSGGRDYGPTPLEDFHPLGGLHAAVASSILGGSFVREASAGLEAAAAVLLFLALAAAGARGRGPLVLLRVLLAGALYEAAAFGAFLGFGAAFDLARPFLAALLAAALAAGYALLGEERDKAAFHARIERYFSAPVLAKIEADRSILLGCEKKILSILFSDIASFSAWSSTRRPEDIRAMLNEYFDAMAGIVFARGGTVDKYIGDGMLAFFGDPLDEADHAARAVAAGVDMQRAVAGLRARWANTIGMAIRIRVGINTGEAVVGDMGSARRLEYTVIGANVNLAQRLEGAARPGCVLVSRTTWLAAFGGEGDEGGPPCAGNPADDPEVRPERAGFIAAKGFTEPVEVYSIPVDPAP